MFDFEKSVREWKGRLRQYDIFEDALVVDLEIQLRDTYEAMKSEGLVDEEAFRKAVAQVGTPETIAAEYRKNRALALDRRRPWRPSRFMPALGASYMKTAWRKMKRQKGYAFINVAGLAVFVACLGLFGLASFLAERRRKKEFTRWVLLANLVAWPAAYFALRSWLQKFPIRTSIPATAFLIAGAAALVIALSFASPNLRTNRF